MQKPHKYAVMYVPHNGLFFSGGDFLDGHQNRIPWSRIIPIWNSRAAALASRDRLRKKWSTQQGDFVLVSVVIDEKDKALLNDEECFQDDED